MIVAARPDKLRKTRWWEYLIRFGFGGAITVATGIIAHRFGAAAGGLFLAFPAILPASATLVDRHEGRTEAEEDAAGAAAGAIGLCAFGVLVWQLAERLHPLWVLSLALGAWLVVAVVVWWATLPRARARLP